MQFLFPGVLFGLFALSIPIIIHFFNFRKYKTVYFSNTQFLRNIKQETKSKSQLKHLLILLSRILLFTSLIFAFSKPFIPVENTKPVSDITHVGIYMDNSFSMDAESKYGRLLDVAKSRAYDIINSFDPSTEFLFLTNDRKAIHNHLVNKGQLQDFINNTVVSPNILKLSEVVNYFSDNYNYQSGESKIFKKIYYLSDFQKNIIDLSEYKEDSLMDIVFIPLATQEIKNIYIDSIWFSVPYRKYLANEDLYVRIVNATSETYTNIPVSLSINDTSRAFTNVSLEPNSSSVVLLNYKNIGKGTFHGKISIQDYPIVYDNDFYFSYDIAMDIKVLILNDENENKYLNSLLAVDDYFSTKNINIKYVDYNSFLNYDVIILNEIRSFSGGTYNELINYVSKGGRLVIIPSPELETDSYNLLLSAIGENLFIGIDTNAIEIGKVDFNSELYSEVFTNTDERYTLPKIDSFLITTDFSNINSKWLLQSKNNHSLLNQLKYKSGKVYTFNFPLSANYNSFCIHPIFVPTFYNIVLNSINPSHLYYVIGKNNRISIIKDVINKEKQFTIRGMDNNMEFIPGIENDGYITTLHLYDQIRHAGNYNVLNGEIELSGFSFNYSKTESKLEYYSGNELEGLIQNHDITNISFIDNNKNNFVKELAQENQGIQLWYYFIIAAILFIIIEIFLIKFFK